MSKFFTFNQNNPGGRFHINKDVREIVIIEAEDGNQANDIAKDIGIYFSGVSNGIDCPCCGDRWFPVDSSDGEVEPMLYGKPIFEAQAHIFYKSFIIYYLNGVKIRGELGK